MAFKILEYNQPHCLQRVHGSALDQKASVIQDSHILKHNQLDYEI